MSNALARKLGLAPLREAKPAALSSPPSEAVPAVLIKPPAVLPGHPEVPFAQPLQPLDMAAAGASAVVFPFLWLLQFRCLLLKKVKILF